MGKRTANDLVVCYAPRTLSAHGVWKGDNPIDYSIPLVILQMTIVVATSRLLVLALRPLRQPRVVSEILVRRSNIRSIDVRTRSRIYRHVFSVEELMVLETLANVGLIYFLFLVGVEMDLTVVRKTGKRALAVAIGGMVLPFVVGACFSFVLRDNKPNSLGTGPYILFIGVALSVTSFPVLARILVELKMTNSEIGKLSMASALLNDTCAWILLVVAIAAAGNGSKSLNSLWVILASAGFVVVCFVVVRPAITWMVRTTSDGEASNDFSICVILTGVMISSFITDAMGTHSVFGAFVFGLIIPNGDLGVVLMDKIGDFVSGLLLPLFFTISGLKTHLASIKSFRTWGVLLLITVLSCAGLIELIVLNIGKDQEVVLDDESFAVMVIVAVVMTAIISPVVATMYKPTKTCISYKRRTLQRSVHDGELRVLACIHTPRNVPATINLLEALNPTNKSPLCIYVLHLVELTGRSSGMLIVHNAHNSSHMALNQTQAQSDNIIQAFKNLERNSSFVSVHPHTAVSPYNSIHDDICGMAEDKHVALIIIPFHKLQTLDGGLKASNPAFRTVNRNLLANAPCSVGILIDRGPSGTSQYSTSEVSHHVGVLFFGGPDDREALACGWRMCEHPGTSLTVMRYIPGADLSPTDDQNDDPRMLTVETNISWENGLDDEYINDFRTKNVDAESIVYIEYVVNNSEETVTAIKNIDDYYDLLIVGRGNGTVSPLLDGLAERSECPELGAIGDIVAESDFSSTMSVLIIQQYVGHSNMNRWDHRIAHYRMTSLSAGGHHRLGKPCKLFGT
ncbi:hypothetical protein GQ457_06G035290 [Hibiscus cannabinus]